jgi:hypothetical protein
MLKVSLVVIHVIFGQQPQTVQVDQPDIATCWKHAEALTEHLKATISASDSYGVGCFIKADNPLLDDKK